MGQKVSSGPRVRTNNYGGPVPAGSGDPNSVAGSSTNGAVLSIGNGHGSYSAAYHASAGASSGGQRNRARSLGHVGNSSSNSSSQNGQALNIPGSSSSNVNVLLHHNNDSDDSSEDGGPLTHGPPRSRGRTFPSLMYPQSLPAHLFAPALLQGIKCPVCNKFVPPDDIECHLVICLTKPRIVYNEDVLSADAGECVICLDDMEQGDTIARLPCLCIYHKSCIDQWFERNRSCPEHPQD